MKLPRPLTFWISRVVGTAQKNGGFTMIELLVVISVIGVLAVAVLSSINPIEQINKGRDTRRRSDAAQLINAVERYFATHEYYPWNYENDADWDPDAFQGGLGGADAFIEMFDFDGPNEVDWDWTDQLVDTAEVKQGYVSRITNETELYVYKEAGSNGTLYSCFIPQSQAFQLDAATKCQNGDTLTTAGPQTNGFCETIDGSIDPDNWICLP